jgi:hypothetical protein
LFLGFFFLTFSPASALASSTEDFKSAPPKTELFPNETGASLRLEKKQNLIFLKDQKINISIPTQHVSSPLAQASSPCECFPNPQPANSFYEIRCPSGYAAYVRCQKICALEPGKYPYKFVCLPPRQ